MRIGQKLLNFALHGFACDSVRVSCSVMTFDSLGTQEIRFGRKTNEIAKFSTLDEKRNSQFWTKFGRKMAN